MCAAVKLVPCCFLSCSYKLYTLMQFIHSIHIRKNLSKPSCSHTLPHKSCAQMLYSYSLTREEPSLSVCFCLTSCRMKRVCGFIIQARICKVDIRPIICFSSFISSPIWAVTRPFFFSFADISS